MAGVRGGVQFSVGILGWNEAKARLQHDELLAGPWRKAMETIASMAGREAKAAAPGGKFNDIAPSIRAWADSKHPVPMYAVVKTSVHHPGEHPNASFARLLEYSPFAFQGRQQSVAHVKGGTATHRVMPRGVNRHRYWMTNALRRVYVQMATVMDQAAHAIEEKWAA